MNVHITKAFESISVAYFVLCAFRFDHLALDNELGGLSSEKRNFILSVAVNCSSQEPQDISSTHTGMLTALDWFPSYLGRYIVDIS